MDRKERKKKLWTISATIEWKKGQKTKKMENHVKKIVHKIQTIGGEVLVEKMNMIKNKCLKREKKTDRVDDEIF